MISSKNDQASEYQGKDKLEHIHKNQQPDDVISLKYDPVSENQGKDAIIKNQSSGKNNYEDVEGNKNPIDKTTKKIVLLDDATSHKSNQKINHGKDALMNPSKKSRA